MSRGLVLTFGQRQSNPTCKIRLFFLGMHSFPCYEMLRGHDKVTDNWGWIQNVLVIATIWVVIVKAPHTFSNIKLFIQVQEFHRGSRFSSFASRLYKDWQQSKIQQNIKIKFFKSMCILSQMNSMTFNDPCPLYFVLIFRKFYYKSSSQSSSSWKSQHLQ